MSMNIFRLTGDMCHLLSILILLRRLHVAKNAEGISLRTQELFVMVSLTRYTDLLTTFYSYYNSLMKIFFITSVSYTIYLIRRREPICSTYDRQQDNFPHWKFLVAPSAVVATVIFLIEYNTRRYGWESLTFHLFDVQGILWTFSIVLESVAILPQLSLLRRYRSIENLTANYVFCMGIYRFLYIFNWVYRAYNEPGYRHHFLVYVGGVLQSLFYVEFFYHYIKCRMTGKEVRYGEEGDIEYHDLSVEALRTEENSSPLIGNSDSGNLRMRGAQNENDGEESPLIVV
mmetsp:Transcript_16818/g.35295  ORF Transcript_16818/g.35295 Transcript_16818/m.35295 type:complete len:287 (-) Transcript_16818:38-898(-)|eukprot:CAMPEP_0171349986 /NCGR_PEP_ID=MMETSP0878-20121228/35269_1 /TAXON_ID=67004 /ORGANISM="Thalassiosira weissflogii, Strain CCMP1336" /LENGTH=286 /DNA_ID=CAMNT_0011854785 /DNA_START=59 /DNA_END=919 /DNA_ORIENTATION=-